MKFLQELKKLILGLAYDERIPARDKKVLMALMLLLISPIDFIPDFSDFGLFDDFLVLCFIWDYFFFVLDSNLLLSHYPWTMKSFANLRAIARALEFFVPNFLRKKMWLYVGDPF